MSTNTTGMNMMHLAMVHGVGTLFGYHYVEDVLQSWRGLLLQRHNFATSC
jgi:hypothetical protein